MFCPTTPANSGGCLFFPTSEVVQIQSSSPIMTRKCSHCINIGHNSRTCARFRWESAPATTTTTCRSVRLFGVRICTSHSSPSNHQLSTSLAANSRCLSLDCISSTSAVSFSPSASSPLSSPRVVVEESTNIGASVHDLLSYRVVPGSHDQIKKWVSWSKDEHKQFLMGMEKLGKGDWRGISKHFVHTRTPTQVASHAQKYFLRRTSLDNKKWRSNLFDMVGGNNNDQSSKRRRPIPADQHLNRRRPASSWNQHLVDAPHLLDLSLGLSSNNDNHSSVPSSHAPINLDLTLAASRLLPQPSSSLGAMRGT